MGCRGPEVGVGVGVCEGEGCVVGCMVSAEVEGVGFGAGGSRGLSPLASTRAPEGGPCS